jgi:hypothetical protein
MQRKDYMTAAQTRAIGNAPRTHENCIRLLKEAKLAPVARPGKTAKDRAKRGG